MSSMMTIALVAEGVTDYEVLRAAVESMLGERSFDLKILQPEGSVAFSGGGNAGPFGGGWKGVYQWCLQAADRGDGQLRNDPLFLHYDLLLIHLDADVASEDPANTVIDPIPALAGILPCEEDCPPPSATTDRLRQAILTWLGEAATPPKTILCTPSKNTEAWVIAMVFPEDSEMAKPNWECHPTPDTRLAQQPKSHRIAKKRADYQARSAEFKDGWPAAVARLSEARRFQDEFTVAAHLVPA